MRNKLTLIFLLGTVTVYAQTKAEFNPKIFINGGQQLQYQLLIPNNFDPQKEYPLVLFLHGAGERGSDNEKQLVHGSQLFKDSISSFPSIVIFPQCPEDSYWSNVEKKIVDGNRTFHFGYGQPPTSSMAAVLNLMDSLSELDYVKKDQLYVGGLSMGGMGTFEILWRRPDMFAAAFAICGGGDVESVEKYNKDLDLWVFHGAKDDVVLPRHSEVMVEALREHGNQVKFTLYPEANHNSWDSAFAEPNLLPWLFSNSK